MIVGFSGKKGSGKSTAAQALADHGFYVHSFAAPIKSMIRMFLGAYGLSESQIAAAEKNKEQAIDGIGLPYRHLCQTLGTEWGRVQVHPDAWVVCAAQAVSGLDDVVFDDVRMENEADFIRSAGGLVVHINRLDTKQDAHASERGIAFKGRDIWINNFGTPGELHADVLEKLGIL